MKLYLHPDYALLRKSFEWIIEAVCMNKLINSRILKSALCDVSLKLIESADAIGVVTIANIETATAWALTFTCIAMLDKEYPFLQAYTGSDNTEGALQLNNGSPLLKFLSILDRMFAKFSKIVSADEADSSAEVMRYAECCGECMRAVMTALKSRRGVYIGEDDSDRWMLLVDSVINNGCMILQSDLVHKDTVTATAMSVVCLQWISRYRRRESNAPSSDVSRSATPSMQLASILQLLDLSSNETSGKAIGVDITISSSNSGVHSDLVRDLSTLPVISKCAVLRACLTVFDDVTLSQKTLTDLSSPESGSSSLLLGPLFSAVVAVCNHSLPLVRLYGLQTLESWFNCFDIVITPISPALSDISHVSGSIEGGLHDVLLPRLRTISNLLINTWSHPSKQVNHMVPTVYQRLINATNTLTLDLRSAANHGDLTAVWKPFIAEALALPAQHRARYQAMTMLIPCVGGKQIIAAQPDVFEALVQAVRLRDVASSSCTVVVALLRDLLQQTHSSAGANARGGAGGAGGVGGAEAVLGEPMATLRPLWATSVATVVCSKDHKTRTNSADYLIPELLKIDPTSGPYLMGVIRSVYSKEACSSTDGSYGAMLWGLVQVCLHARSMTLPGKDILARRVSDISIITEGVTAVALHDAVATSSEGIAGAQEVDLGPTLCDEEVTWACLSDDVDLRLAALTLLTGNDPVPSD